MLQVHFSLSEYLWCIFTLCVALLLLLRWCHWCYYYFCMRFRRFAVGLVHSVSRPKAQIRRDVLSNGEYRKREPIRICTTIGGATIWDRTWTSKHLFHFAIYIFFSIASRRRLTRFASLFFLCGRDRVGGACEWWLLHREIKCIEPRRRKAKCSCSIHINVDEKEDQEQVVKITWVVCASHVQQECEWERDAASYLCEAFTLAKK